MPLLLIAFLPLHQSIAQPHFEYRAQVWSFTSKKSAETVQKKAKKVQHTQGVSL